MLDFKREIAESLAGLDYLNDPEATEKAEELKGMDHSCDAAIIFAERHADLAEKMAREEKDETRRRELLKIADVCRWVPAHAPRDLWEALQMYWFVHLGTITELNGWDAMNPGHLDQHLWPFYERGLEEGTLTREQAKELISCLWIKFNNHPAPPKVGVTAAESGTYNDFTNINLGGLKRDGSDAVNEVSFLILEVIDELHLLQPQANIQLSRKTPDHFLKAACRVIRNGYGYPSVFNADEVITEQVRLGKSVEDAREGGLQRLHRDRLLRQGSLRPDRVSQHPQGTRTGPERRRRSSHRQADRPEDRRSARFQQLRRALRRLRQAASLTSWI